MESHFGSRCPLYTPRTRPDGGLEVRVHHTNKEVTRIIQQNPESSHFYHCFDTWSRSSIRAKYWMAVLVAEYPEQFEQNLVTFVWPTDDEWKEDLVVVVEESAPLERLLKDKFKVNGFGLVNRARNVHPPLPDPVLREVEEIGRLRNTIVHEADRCPRLPSREGFRRQCAKVQAQLEEIAQSRNFNGPKTGG